MRKSSEVSAGPPHGLYSFALLLLCLPIIFSQSGTYFVRKTEAYATYNSWIITFTVDIQPYAFALEHLSNEMKGCDDALTSLIQANEQLDKLNQSGLNDFNSAKVRQDALNLLSQEVDQFKREYDNAQNMFHEIKILAMKASRVQKQSILPFVGNLLSSLFGTATKSDLQKLKRAFMSLRDSELELTHIVGDSLTLMNKTEMQVKENHDTIQRLSNVSKLVNNELKQLYGVLQNYVVPEITYLQFVARVHDMFHLVNKALDKMQWSMKNLQDQLSQSAHGFLSMQLLKPSDITSVMRQIQNKLPQEMSLPFSLNDRSLLLYYKHLHPLVVSDKNRFHVIVALPIIPNKAKYDIFQAIQVPVPHPNMSLSASYKLESDFLAISSDQTRYTYLTSQEVMMCDQGPMCHMKTPIFKLSTYPSCVLALYLKDSNKIKTTCQSSFTHSVQVPVVKPLFAGHWLLSTSKPFELFLSCDQKSPRMTKSNIDIGVKVITLSTRCAGYSSYFELPMYVSGDSSVLVKEYFDKELIFSNLTINIWSQPSSVLSELSNVNKLLDAQSNDSMAKFEMSSVSPQPLVK